MDKIKLYTDAWTELTDLQVNVLFGHLPYYWDKWNAGESIYLSQCPHGDRGSVQVGLSDYSEADPDDISPAGIRAFGDDELKKYFEFVLPENEEDQDDGAWRNDPLTKIKQEMEEL